MADDIVERLRRCPDQFPPYSVRTDAADEIERLRAAGDRLAAAVNAVNCSGPRAEMIELTEAYIEWETRRG